MTRKRAILLIIGLVAVASVVAALVARATAGQGVYAGPGMTPQNISALVSEQTLEAGIPTELGGSTGDLSPDAGTVHRLGYGALAWVKTGRICIYQNLSGGCLDHVSKPIEVVVADPDVVGGGEPARVSGLATDEVSSVTIKLDDGRSITGNPVANFYDVQLPEGVPPWTPFTIEAQLANRSTYSERVNALAAR